MPTNTEQYLPYLTRVLTPARLRHSLGVVEVMGELAGVYALDREQALTAGLLHDVGKDLPPERVEQIVREAGIELPYPCDGDFVHYLHGPVGAYLARAELGIRDPLVLDGISMHTFSGDGPNFNHPLIWCLRFSDVLEPTRDWSKASWPNAGPDALRELAFAGQLEPAARCLAGMLIERFTVTGEPVHPHMRRALVDMAG